MFRCTQTFEAPWRSGLGTTTIEAGEFVTANSEYVEDFPEMFTDATEERASFTRACRTAWHIERQRRASHRLRRPGHRTARALRPRSRSVRTSPRAANAPPAGDPDPEPGEDPHAVDPRALAVTL